MTKKSQKKSPVKSSVPTDMLPEIDKFVRDYHLSGRGEAFLLCFRIVRQILKILYMLEKMIPMMAKIIEFMEKEEVQKKK